MLSLAFALTTALCGIVMLRSACQRYATPTDAAVCVVPVVPAQSR
ncbi:hypothetical protein SA496_26380 [Pseudomonas sp. JS3066]|jgi:hypothetical protein|nr:MULTISPECIES: hypothetical protein [unclassified Pseudomonas]WVK93198.1 hypothetical protein SA496_26380 [Pseudomonas sp. JS3066]